MSEVQISDAQLRAIILMLLDEVDAQLPEGVHTGLRKAADSHPAGDAWRAVRAMPAGEWAAACTFATNPFRNMWMAGVLEKARAIASSADPAA